jgi:hypothetical protein
MKPDFMVPIYIRIPTNPGIRFDYPVLSSLPIYSRNWSFLSRFFTRVL